MSIIPDISLGRNSKRYTHNMSFDNNTTMPFGVVQPLMSQRLEANSKISVNMRQLVRLAPMPVPTFARLNMVNEVSFVPTVDVCPYYEALVSQMSFSNGTKTYYPTQLPQTNNSTLLWLLLSNYDFACWSYYKYNGSNYTHSLVEFASISESQIQTLSGLLANAFKLKTSVLGSGFPFLTDDSYYGYYKGGKYILPDGADFAYELSGNELLTFRLTSQGRRLRSVLLGLGYSLSAGDTSSVSLIPLLSYYKAWFDLYYPVRDLNWTDTSAYQLIKVIEDYGYNFSLSSSTQFSPEVLQLFQNFLYSCADTFYTSKDDIVSVHRSNVNVVASPKVPMDIIGPNSSTITNLTVSTGSLPVVYPGSQFGLITLQALQRFSRYFNKNSVIGKRISKFLQVHYGASVANSLYKDANHIGSFSYPLSVDDVMSTSDTFEVTGDTSKGDMLGSYAGKGIGFDKSHFEFTAPTFGYFFVLSSVSTPTGYFQGNSGDLYVTDFDSVPTPDYDALGFEVSPRGQFIDDNCLMLPTSKVNFSSGFGFVPRYTGLKYHKNIVNGDISRRSVSSSLSAYHLNRIITSNRLDQKNLDTSSGVTFSVTESTSTVPSASVEWRYLAKAPWLGDYNRIFYNQDIYDVRAFGLYTDAFGPDDNFIVQTVFESKVTNQYKPLSQSWDTYEETTDDSSVDVRPE